MIPAAPTPRQAVPADREAIAHVLTAAFWEDPVWQPMFPASDPAEREHQARTFWSFMVNEALQYPDSAVAVGPDGDIAAAAIWFPPGADEIREASLEPHAALTQHLLGADGAAAIDEVGRRFGEARPSEPHAYLTLLAVAPEWRGRGAGMGLLRHTLTRFDETGIASYLESSNPVNDARYERLGYRRVGAVEVPSGARASTYWRDPA